jgi:hypothetical protein
MPYRGNVPSAAMSEICIPLHSPEPVIPVITSDGRRLHDAFAVIPGDKPVTDQTLGPGALRCYVCRGTRFWTSLFNRTICTHCHPPAAPGLVAGWVDSVANPTEVNSR